MVTQSLVLQDQPNLDLDPTKVQGTFCVCDVLPLLPENFSPFPSSLLSFLVSILTQVEGTTILHLKRSTSPTRLLWSRTGCPTSVNPSWSYSVGQDPDRSSPPRFPPQDVPCRFLLLPNSFYFQIKREWTFFSPHFLEVF